MGFLLKVGGPGMKLGHRVGEQMPTLPTQIRRPWPLVEAVNYCLFKWGSKRPSNLSQETLSTHEITQDAGVLGLGYFLVSKPIVHIANINISKIASAPFLILA